MELRELRRQLLYQIAINEQLSVDAETTIFRHKTVLIVQIGDDCYTVRSAVYHRAVDRIMALIEHGDATGFSHKRQRPVLPAPPSEHRAYYGVSKVLSPTRPWTAQLWHHGTTHNLGRYADAADAARAYDAYVLANGLNKPLNFPDQVSKAS